MTVFCNQTIISNDTNNALKSTLEKSEINFFFFKEITFKIDFYKTKRKPAINEGKKNMIQTIS